MHENQPNHESQPNVDPTVEMMITRFTAHVDACIKKLKDELTGHFDPLHDDLAERMAIMEERVDIVTDTVNRGVVEIRKDTGITKVLATRAYAGEGASAPAPETPQPGDPRPVEIDRAVAADPKDGVQRVDLPEYGAVMYLRPGTDADVAWAAGGSSIRARRSGR